ncbi:MAG: peptidoglycan -binding protein, partial [Rhodospirillales bacterium]|nr:peptidoglycan -binding protein [Rhodospirillales bacterium]
MAISLRRGRRMPDNTWPGFVDALASLLMVVIFLLMVFVLAQFFLGEALSGRDQALDRLRGQVGELAELLALERKASEDLRLNVSQLSEELQASVRHRDDLGASLRSMEASLQTSRETAERQKGELADLSHQVEALTALRDELRAQIADASGKLKGAESALADEKKISEEARAEIALMNKQLGALRDQISQLSAALEASEEKAREQNVQIVSLGKRLNAALAGKVQELSRYRSEFFGRLREVLGNQPGIRVVGDRFVFQSEVLFQTGSAELGPAGQAQIGSLAETLADLSKRIPADVDWILRVDGHTDRVPIRTEKFPSNWELSTARAISVVKHLIDRGIPANRLAAAGFGENQPLDAGESDEAYSLNRRIELKLDQ